MTKRLYYHDSYLRQFEAQVIRIEPAGADRFHVFLDQTAFYPTSGGQPNDVGTLDGVAVQDVLETENEEIVHVTAQAPPGERVHGVIDWGRRFDHMQQHTGQHLLSAAFVRLFDFPTVGFHLGDKTSTIDLGTSTLAGRQLRAAEELANQIVFEDRPVRILFRQSEELAEGTLRRKVERAGKWRLIEIPGFDLIPCGGTHVVRSGEVGLIWVRGMEKQKGNVRLEFVCGSRVLAWARAEHRILSEAARLLTTGTSDLPRVIQKQMAELRAAEKVRLRLLERLAGYEARALLAEAEAIGGHRLVRKVFDDAEVSYLRMVARELLAESRVVALLASRSQPVGLIFARSPDAAEDMGVLLRETLTQYAGKGGGKPDFAQGSLLDGERVEAALSLARDKLRREAGALE